MTISSVKVQTATPHLLIFPFFSKGHIIPVLDLAHRLLIRHGSTGLTITVLLTPDNLSLLQPLLSLHPPTSLQPLVLSPPDAPAPPKGLIDKILSLRKLHSPILDWFRSHPSPPTAILSDFFLGWTHYLAQEAGIPRLVFCPSGAAGTAELYALWRDAPKNEHPEGSPDFAVRFDGIPNSPSYPWWQISHVYKTPNPNWGFFRDCMVCNLKSSGTVFNSFTELERVYFDYLKKEMGHDRVWAVGPLLPPEEEDLSNSAQRGGPSSVPAEDVLNWLDQRRDCSVVYVCFGSRTTLAADQTAALGKALESSGVDFIWCVPVSGDGAPEVGYEDRVAGRGLIIKGWAPQLAILRHPALAAFLTHCGWNSVLESISAGVMMLTWPIGADQFTDARLLVEELGVGMRVRCGGPENVPDPDELEALLRESVAEDRAERERVRRLRAAAMDAVTEGGSSYKNLDELARYLRKGVVDEWFF